MSLTRPAAPSYSCSRKTHKSAWPNPFSKQRKRPRLAHSGLFLFALDTDHGPAAWNLYFCKGPLVFKAGTAGSLLPCNERSLLWAQGQLRPGVQRGAYAKAPTPVILKRATSFSPPLRHKPDISTCQQVVVAVLPFPGTQPRHSTPSHILAEGSSSPAQACSPAPHCPWNETSILPGASRPSMNLTLWLLFPIPTVASAAGIFISLCFQLILFWLPRISFLSLLSNSYSSSKTQLRCCHCFLMYGSPSVLPWLLVYTSITALRKRPSTCSKPPKPRHHRGEAL